MIYVKEDESEEVTMVSIDNKENPNYVYLETDGGYFQYLIPVVDAKDYDNVDTEKVLDVCHKDFSMVENPNGDSTTEYDYSSGVTVPQSVIDVAEEKTNTELRE